MLSRPYGEVPTPGCSKLRLSLTRLRVLLAATDQRNSPQSGNRGIPRRCRVRTCAPTRHCSRAPAHLEKWTLLPLRFSRTMSDISVPSSVQPPPLLSDP